MFVFLKHNSSQKHQEFPNKCFELYNVNDNCNDIYFTVKDSVAIFLKPTRYFFLRVAIENCLFDQKAACYIKTAQNGSR